MEKSWLIQRLKKPTGFNNPFSFGGGYKNGGLSDAAMAEIMKYCSFDYMGAAEFEFGALPEALIKMQNNKNLQQFELTTDKRNIIYVICDKNDFPEISTRIRHWTKKNHDSAFRVREHIGLNEALVADDPRHIGWIELDNGFIFTISKELSDGFYKLLNS